MNTNTDDTPEDFDYVPITPGGTACTWLASPTEDEAWAALLKEAAHMPYKTKENFIARGYTIERWPGGIAS